MPRFKCWDCEEEILNAKIPEEIQKKCQRDSEGFLYLICTKCVEEEDRLEALEKEKAEGNIEDCSKNLVPEKIFVVKNHCFKDTEIPFEVQEREVIAIKGDSYILSDEKGLQVSAESINQINLDNLLQENIGFFTNKEIIKEQLLVLHKDLLSKFKFLLSSIQSKSLELDIADTDTFIKERIDEAFALNSLIGSDYGGIFSMNITTIVDLSEKKSDLIIYVEPVYEGILENEDEENTKLGLSKAGDISTPKKSSINFRHKKNLYNSQLFVFAPVEETAATELLKEQLKVLINYHKKHLEENAIFISERLKELEDNSTYFTK